MTHRPLPAGLLILGLATTIPDASAQQGKPDKDLTTLSLEELMKVNMSVTSAARRAQRLGNVASAVHVLTADDIKRAGAHDPRCAPSRAGHAGRADRREQVVRLGAGTAERGFGAFRWGGKIGAETYWRAGIQGLSRASLERNDSGITPPSSLGGTFGFRLDSQGGPNAWHANAGFNGGAAGATPIRYAFTTPFKPPFNNRVKGETAHVLGRWTRALSPNSDPEAQPHASHEAAELHVLNVLAQTFDIELQHRAEWSERHQFVWGGGYRLRETKLDGILRGGTRLSTPGTVSVPG